MIKNSVDEYGVKPLPNGKRFFCIGIILVGAINFPGIGYNSKQIISKQIIGGGIHGKTRGEVLSPDLIRLRYI